MHPLWSHNTHQSEMLRENTYQWQEVESMSVADEVAQLEAENERLRATLNALLDAVKAAASALAAVDEPRPIELPPEQQPLPEQELVERHGVPGGAYRVSPEDVLKDRMM